MRFSESFKNGDIVLILLLSVGLVHLFYLFIFSTLQIYPMAWLNVASVAAYVAAMCLHAKGKTIIAGVLTSVEITIHQITGTVLLGFNSGFVIVYLCLFLFQFSMFERLMVKVGLTIFGYLWIFFILFNQNLLHPIYAQFADLMFAINIFIVGTFMLIYGTLATLTPAKKISELIDLAYHDQLTGLFNRKYFMDKLNPKIAQANEPFILAICDIDNFKKVNDTYGHESGDLALRLISNALLSSRASVIRWGGEEFVLYAKNKDFSSALYYLDEIRKSICDINFLGSKQLSISIGAVFSDSAGDYAHLLQIADMALYRCKQGSKNCVQLHDLSQNTDSDKAIACSATLSAQEALAKSNRR